MEEGRLITGADNFPCDTIAGTSPASNQSRTPYFDKGAYRQTPASLGRNALFEQDQVTDVWHLPTATGGKGHGAQFPLALPGRCISCRRTKKV
jgi:DNA modification methylase